MLLKNGARRRVVLIQIGDNSATLTPFGSLIRITPTRAGCAKSWSARLRGARFVFSMISVGLRRASIRPTFWTLDEKILQNERALATVQGGTAGQARYL